LFKRNPGFLLKKKEKLTQQKVEILAIALGTKANRKRTNDKIYYANRPIF
jgi:hypothetical protein